MHLLNKRNRWYPYKFCSVPLRLTLDLLQTALPVFLAACPSARPPHMLDILLKGGLNLSHFVAADVAICVTTGRPLLCRYHVPWSLDLCNEFMEKVENQGSQWLFGIPDQFILLIGYIDGLVKNATAAGITVDSGLLAQIEDDVRRIQVSPCESNDPSLVARMAVQQCWREAVIVYLMALGGAHALDPRVGPRRDS
ncbi:Fungal Zn(2)-Cys(6) binuclear cluster domain [Rhizoctonia solani]|uniref:Fungal Zn(2)-Cys(6) binuclear cluster domain n=1 Tax=Rhizoctonia solani TaxID=456999 RepID=A0A8H8NRE8_9AGAM|nr:Fungal Zn(2)-Cys(6) binuclear cluster domain [Rhizoctonia solani]QRW18616.1 Fungal Zn(2)-Cys(6) binuclear cluster domain [Rhizoctonia solani]